jgi:hypothetical protein
MIEDDDTRDHAGNGGRDEQLTTWEELAYARGQLRGVNEGRADWDCRELQQAMLPQ